ncbi:hypothetical protein AAFF_G00189650 [Aldrovandia affinis]|uniref:Rab-GAP TBC domain-containing protein n=1 Tax=Aldrovandia affinis TaxID=143900 RepID=A0AAD7RJH7_9TELE|nr:hypothetical protein AAFF_G00189650 [Aldrovandia affinis]
MAAEEERDVVCVRVKKSEGASPPEFRSFAVDPQITSLEVLQHILIRAFKLNGKHTFGISYLLRDRGDVEVYLSLLSDWDLDAAFVSAAKPYLQLKIDLNPSEDSPVLEDWDIISPKDVISSDLLPGEKRSLAAAALPFTQSLLSQVGRTLSRVQQALSWTYGDEVKLFKPPLSDAEFHGYLNSQGQLSRPEDLRLRIYHGGVEPSLRKVVWRYLLNVYPDGLTGQERMDYMKRKTREYEQLKGQWAVRASPEDLEFIRGNVLKDVLRTDRAHPYYAGSEDSPHLTALTDLLTTYAITHPQVSYCQGMSDIASPILAVMDNEAHAFICFCGIMKRLEGNFRADGHLMSVKFQHLKLLLQYSDPEFYAYLVSRSADDLFFCYRWILLELKHEFAFEDALRMLEVTWSSLRPDPPKTEVELLGSQARGGRDGGGTGGEAEGQAAQDESAEEQRERELLIRGEDTPPGRWSPNGKKTSPLSPGFPSWRNASSPPATMSPPSQATPTSPFSFLNGRAESPATGMHGSSHFTQSGASSPATPMGKPCPSSPSFSSAPSHLLLSSPILPALLPPPQEFGRGNPFMLFLCLSILLEHREHIVKNGCDYNELAMHFDRLVRRHNLARVLQRAKVLFADYLQSEVWDSEEGDEVSSDSPIAGGIPNTGPLSPPPPPSLESTSPNSTHNMGARTAAESMFESLGLRRKE